MKVATQQELFEGQCVPVCLEHGSKRELDLNVPTLSTYVEALNGNWNVLEIVVLKARRYYPRTMGYTINRYIR